MTHAIILRELTTAPRTASELSYLLGVPGAVMRNTLAMMYFAKLVTCDTTGYYHPTP